MSVPDIHRNVLDNLLDGVVVVADGGLIETLNPAAERILGIGPGEAEGHGFAELFITRDGFDDFTQLILDATLRGAEPERRVVAVERDGESRSLSVATSYLRTAREDAGPRAVIAVFSDITELRELRETELRLAKAAEEQHGLLQNAYREIEERNSALAAALRKVRFVQGFGILLVFGLFIGAGLWTWRPAELFAGMSFLEDLWTEAGAARAVPSESEAGGASRTLKVSPRAVSSSLTFKGRLAPWRQLDIKSPASGTIAAVRVEEGQKVAEGEVLLELDLSKQERTYQSRRLSFVKARENHEMLKNWEKSPDMIQARRSFTKAQMSIDARRSKIRKSRFLFEAGADRVGRGGGRGARVPERAAGFRIGEGRVRGGAREGRRRSAGGREAGDGERPGGDVGGEGGAQGERGPRAVRGHRLSPDRQAQGPGRRRHAEKGGYPVPAWGTSRASRPTRRRTRSDVIKLKPGQKVTVTGNAFPGVRLPAVVRSVAAEADPKKPRKAVFPVSILLDEIEPAVQAGIRPGMSAKMRIVTYRNPKALMVPLDAVRRRGGRNWLRVVDPESGEAREREVEIGPTTRRQVEIAAGLKAGETVVLPGG